MNIPDYVSPVIGHRVWRCDGGLVSINGERWYPTRPLTARCNAGLGISPVRRAAAVAVPHQAPQMSCTCGIYATKSRDQLPWIGFGLYGSLCGEVYLWGTVVEHELGWRAQFAYPKSLTLSTESLWCNLFVQREPTMKELELRLATLTAYRANMFMAHAKEKIALWTKHSGYDSAGLEHLREVATRRVSVPVAVLTGSHRWPILLQNGVEAKHAAEIVFYDVHLPLNGTDPIVRQIQDPCSRVVVIDLSPDNRPAATNAIGAIREANNQIFVFVRGERRPISVMATMRAGADHYLARDGRFDVQDAFTSLSIRGTSMRPKGGASPPGGLPPPPAVPVLSPWNWPRRPRPREVAWVI